MLIRDHLNNDECIVDEEGEQLIYVKLFLGSQAGVALTKRCQNDNHICFTILGEDDNSWFPIGDSTSSFWLPEYIEVLQYVREWLLEHADKDEQWGYKFK